MSADTERGREVLRRLLLRYNEHPAERSTVMAEIDRRFARELAVLVLDAAGFSRTVQSSGIVSFLAVLERLERVISPQVESHGGRVLRREADNVYAVFDEPGAALAATIEVFEELRAVDEALPKGEEMSVSAGIGFGTLLAVGDDDVYGDEMNMASKLGEDLANHGEVLLTPAAHDAVAATGEHEFEELNVTLSGLDVTAYRLVMADPAGGTPSPPG